MLLVLSSMSPVFILWAVRGSDLIPDRRLLFVCGTLFVIPNAYLLWIVRRAASRRVQRTIEIAQADDHRHDLVTYLFAMLLPFYTVDLSTAREIGATLAAFLIVVVLFTSLGLHYLNFLVALFGYHCFQAYSPTPGTDTVGASSFIVITKNPTLRTGSKLTGFLVSSTLLIEKRE